MSSASAVRAGRAFVEITANDTHFQRTLKKTQHSIVRLSSTLKRAGTGLAIAGGAMGVPMLLAAQSTATFQDALLELQGAVSDITPEQMAAVREESLRLSKSMGIAPTKIAQAFTLLIKAGMGVEEALAGAGRAAVEFAQVSGVDAAQAAEFMKVAMNVFGLSAQQAADTLSAAADSSETSIASMIESFALVASVAKGTNQSLFGLSQGLAILARYGIKGEEAGTGIKTLLVKLLAPTNDAKEALAQLGLSMESLVDNQGKLLPLAQIAEIFAESMKGMDASAREAMLTNEALVKVFDVRGIRVIHAFAEQGEAGFNRVAEAMENSRTVSQKFEIAMSGLTGVGNALFAVVERLAIAFSDRYFTAAVRVAAQAVIPIIDAMSWLLTSVPVLSPILASVSGAMVTIGVAALGAGAMLQFVNFGLRGYIGFAATATLMTRAFSVAVGGLTAALVGLRAVMQAIPGWGWALAAITALGGLAYWMSTASTQADAASKSGIMRDANRPPMAGQGAAGMAGAQPGLGAGDSASTFSGQIASRLVFGPSLTAAQETADNTGRMADGIDELVQATMRGEAVGEDSLQAFAAAGAAALEAQVSTIPQVSAIRGGIKALSPVMAGGVAARSDRDLLSASERTALASETTAALMRQMLQANGPTIQFA